MSLATSAELRLSASEHGKYERGSKKKKKNVEAFPKHKVYVYGYGGRAFYRYDLFPERKGVEV